MTTDMPEARLLQLEEINEGDLITERVVVTGELLRQFIEVSGDRALGHMDADHARSMGYDRELVHGFLVALPYSRLLGMQLPGCNTVIHQLQFEAIAPVYVGDELTYQVRVARVVPAVKTVVLELTAADQSGKMVNRGRGTCVFRR